MKITAQPQRPKSVRSRSVLVLDKNGALVTSIADPNLLNGPWELTVHDMGDQALLFVSNVLDGTVTRLQLEVAANTVTAENMTRIHLEGTHNRR